MSRKVLLLSIMISVFLISLVSANMDYAASSNGGIASYSIDDIGYANGVAEGNIGNINDGNDATYFGVKAQYPDRGAWSQFSATIMFSQTVSKITQINWIKDLRILYGLDEAYYFCELYVLQEGYWNHAGNCYAPGFSSPGSLTGNWENVDGVKASLTARVGGERRFGGAYTYARLYELKAFGEDIIPKPICGNNILEEGEQCDDGNLIDNDGCSSICEIEEFECCYDEDCDDDYYSDNYCDSGDVYTKFHDFFCENGQCGEDVFSELVEDCGEEEYGEWNNYCKGNEIWEQRTNYLRGCSSNSCYETEDYEKKYVDTCMYDCVNGECIDEPEPVCGNNILEQGEECDDGNLIDGDGCSSICEIESQEPACYIDSDCGINHCLGGPNYCLNGDVYQDFIVYTCNNPGQANAYCSDDTAPWLLEECDYMCENGQCIDEPEPPVNVCGDGVLNIGVEECDDGNLIDNDGCSSICEIEEPEPPACCVDSDCDDDYYEDKYCYEGDVYRDFHDFFCEDGECKEDIIKQLFDKCDSDENCEDGECVEDDDDDDDDDDSTCNDRPLYNNCKLSEVEDVLVVYDTLENDVEVIDDINVIGQSQEKITDNSWILYLFIGIGALIVIILIILGVKG